MEETCSFNQYTQLRLEQRSTGSRPIPLPEGSKSSHTLHMCGKLRIPPSQHLPKPATTQAVPAPQALHTSDLCCTHKCTHTCIHTLWAGRQTSTTHTRLKISSHRSARGDSHLTHHLSKAIAFFLRLAESCRLLLFWNAWFNPHGAPRAEMPYFRSASLVPKT